VRFDVDGTLIDSNGAHALSWQQALAEHGKPVPLDQVRRLIGMGGDKLLPGLSGIEEESAVGKAISARSKPDPDIVHAALSRADAAADGAVMVGDTPYDLEAANRAGIPAIALRCGRTWADVDFARGIAIFDDPTALLNHWQGGVAQL